MSADIKPTIRSLSSDEVFPVTGWPAEPDRSVTLLRAKRGVRKPSTGFWGGHGAEDIGAVVWAPSEGLESVMPVAVKVAAMFRLSAPDPLDRNRVVCMVEPPINPEHADAVACIVSGMTGRRVWCVTPMRSPNYFMVEPVGS